MGKLLRRLFFSTTEINGSFYRLPSEETVIKWTESVPDNFLFCPKMSRYLTHMKKLRDPEEPLERFFSVFEFMKRSWACADTVTACAAIPL